MTYSIPATSPVLWSTVICMNSLVLATRAAEFGAGANMQQPRGVAATQTRWNTTMVVGYKLSMRIADMGDNDITNVTHFALTPVSASDFIGNFTGSSTAYKWPGASANVQWQACLQHPHTKHGLLGTALTDGTKDASLYISNGCNMSYLVSEPMWKAESNYAEHLATTIPAAYRQYMVLTWFWDSPTTAGTENRRYIADMFETFWVKLWDPRMPALITLADDVGAEAALGFLRDHDRKMEIEKPLDSEIKEPDEKEWETELKAMSIEEPPVLQRTPSKLPLLPVCKSASHPKTAHAQVKSCIFN